MRMMVNLSVTRQRILQTLRYMGMSEDLTGFEYTIAAVDYVLHTDSWPIQYSSEKGVYGKVAAEFDNSWRNVERSLRYSIQNVYNQPDLSRLLTVVGYSCHPDKGVPQVSTFLRSLANHIKLEVMNSDTEA